MTRPTYLYGKSLLNHLAQIQIFDSQHIAQREYMHDILRIISIDMILYTSAAPIKT